MEEISIYVHLPFCEQKCYYCAFNSFCADEKQKEDYLNLLRKEIEKRKTTRPVKSVYFGGGTPSVLTCQQFERVVKAIYANFQVLDRAEITIEANPNSITEEKLLCWQKNGVNRLSIGVQSLRDKSLKRIGRLHDRKMAIEKIKLAKKYFNNISADLLIGLEGESGKDLCKYAKLLLELGVKHISCYLLEVYKNTKLFELIEKKKYQPLEDGEAVQALNKLSNYLQDEGMTRYEISNFAFEGFESQHNLNYWKRGEYLGLGLSAHSFEGNKRYKNAETIAEYSDFNIEEEILTSQEEAEELIMLSLRCNLGLNLQELKKLGVDLTENEYYKQYLKDGILIKKDQTVWLSPLFYHLSNTIISNLL